MSSVKDITGKVFGRLTANSYEGLDKHRKAVWSCECECGNVVITLSSSLLSGLTKSCGCYKKDVLKTLHKTHGKSYTKEYQAWSRMKDRCLNPNNKDYSEYSGLGICEAFLNFEYFMEQIGPPPSLSGRLSVDRIENSKGYCEGNVRWADDAMQNQNKQMRADNNSGVTGVCYVDGRWIAFWSEGGKSRSKSFSVLKYGKSEALTLAISFRESMINLLNSYGEKYTENHGKSEREVE